MSQHGTVQTWAEYAAARLLLGALGTMPRPAAVVAGRAAGRLAYALAGRLRRTGEVNLRLAFPDMNADERARVLRGTFDSLGRMLGEFSQFPRATPESLRAVVEYEGLEHLRAAHARGRGVLTLTSHLGAWELSSFALAARGFPLTFLVRRLDNPRIEAFVERIRTRYGNQSLDKKAAARKALRLLRTGGALGILADLNTHPHEGRFVPFFGHLACTTTGVATLALRTGATVIPVHTAWETSRRRHVVRFEPALELIRTGDDMLDVQANTELFAAVIESHIRAHPEQWLWIHKRWNTRPAGEPCFYDRTPNIQTTPRTLSEPITQSKPLRSKQMF